VGRSKSRPVSVASKFPNFGNQKGPVQFSFGPSSLGLGVSQSQVRFDYSQAQIPSRAYFADYCDVKRLRNRVALTFGKLNAAGTALRTQVEIAFPQQMFDRQLWASSVALRDLLRKFALGSPLERQQTLSESEKLQTFAANNLFMAANDEDAVLDFYYLSPRSAYLQSVGGSSAIDFEPVIRISSDSALLLEFFERCEPHVKEKHYESTQHEQLATGNHR